MDRSPFDKQNRIISSWSLPVPATATECNRLIRYILQGNGTDSGHIGDHVRLSRKYHQRWVGTRVRIKRRKGRRYSGRQGTVIALQARTADEVEQARLTCRRHTPHPFKALVHLEGITKPVTISLSLLLLVERQEQRTLF